MSKTVGDIAINVTADIGPLVRETGRAKSALNGLDRATDGMARGLKNMGDAASDLGGKLSMVTAAMTAAIAGAFAFTKGTADQARAVENLSRVAGTTPAVFQRMAAASKTVGVEQDKLADILKDVQDKTGEFLSTGGGPMADFFEHIAPKVGITAEAFRGLSGPDALQLYQRSLEEAGVSQEEMTFYMEALASDATALIPLLRGNGTEMKKLGEAAAGAGAVLGNDALAASDAFNTELTALMTSLTGVKNELAVALMPVMTEFMAAIRDNVIPAIRDAIGGITEWIEWFGNLPDSVQTAATAIAAAFAAGGPVLLALAAVSSAISTLIAATGPVGLFIAAAAALYTAWQVWGDDIKAAIGPAVDWITEKFNGFIAILENVKRVAGEVGSAIVNALTFGQSGTAQAGDPLQYPGGGSVGDRPVDFSGDPEAAPGAAIGAQTANGMVHGFVGTVTSRQGEIDAAINAVPGRARELLGIQSPSRVFAEIGAFVGQGFADGIASAQGQIAEVVGTMGKVAVDGANTTTDDVLAAMGTLFQGNKKISAALAFVSMMQGAAKELEKGVFGFGSMAAVLARGAAIIASIKSATPSGGGNAAAARSGAVAAPVAAPSGGGGGAAAAPSQAQIYNISLVGSTQSTDSVRALFERMNDGLKAGYRLEGIRVNG